MRMLKIQVPPIGMRVPITPKDLVAPDSVPRKKSQEESKGEIDMNLQDEIKSLKQRIAELERQQEFPQDEDKYWYVGMRGNVFSSEWEGLPSEEHMLEVGNIFKTEDEAYFAVEKLKVESELRKFSRPFKYGDLNFEILWNNHENNIELDWSGYVVRQSVIYFESGEIAEKAIESVGEERIKKYIFGMED